MVSALYRQTRTYFRSRRNERLSQEIHRMTAPVKVLDVGGKRHFWETVEAATYCRITTLNTDGTADVTGDARDLSRYADDSFDLVVSNSVIEHVGGWADIKTACQEMRRVGKHGWIQTPSPAFPVELHLILPLVHWLPVAMQRWALRYLPSRILHDHSANEIREVLEGINLISKWELATLFPGDRIDTEWFLFPKSHIIRW